MKTGFDYLMKINPILNEVQHDLNKFCKLGYHAESCINYNHICVKLYNYGIIGFNNELYEEIINYIKSNGSIFIDDIFITTSSTNITIYPIISLENIKI